MYRIWDLWLWHYCTAWMLSYVLSLVILSIVFLLQYRSDKKVYDQLVMAKREGRDHGPEYKRLMAIYNINVYEYLQFKENKQIFNVQASKLHANALTQQVITVMMAEFSDDEKSHSPDAPKTLQSPIEKL